MSEQASDIVVETGVTGQAETLDDINNQDFILYEVEVEFDDGEFIGQLRFFTDRFSATVERTSQRGLYREYSWKYEQIMSTMLCDNNYKNYLFVELDSQDPNQRNQRLSIMFPNRVDRNKYAFRFKIMACLYKSSIFKNSS